MNFLLPIATVSGALAALLRSFDSDIEEVVLIEGPAGQAFPVEFEWVGWNEPLEGGPVTRGANQTSADALVVARTWMGNRAYIFEWKYCERYPSPQDKGQGARGAGRVARYRDLYSCASSSFTGEVPLRDLLFDPFYQLMRLCLLADRMCREGVTEHLGVAEACVVVVCPIQNLAYRNVVRTTPLAQRFPGVSGVEEVMQRTLRRPHTLRFFSPEDLGGALAASPAGPRLRSWLEYHDRRYGWGVQSSTTVG